MEQSAVDLLVHLQCCQPEFVTASWHAGMLRAAGYSSCDWPASLVCQLEVVILSGAKLAVRDLVVAVRLIDCGRRQCTVSQLTGHWLRCKVRSTAAVFSQMGMPSRLHLCMVVNQGYMAVHMSSHIITACH